MHYSADSSLSILKSIVQHVTPVITQVESFKSPRDVFDEKQRNIADRFEVVCSRIASGGLAGEEGRELGKRAFEYGEEKNQLSVDYEAHKADQEAAYEQRLNRYLIDLCQGLLVILGQPLVAECLSNLSWAPVASTTTDSMLSTSKHKDGRDLEEVGSSTTLISSGDAETVLGQDPTAQPSGHAEKAGQSDEVTEQVTSNAEEPTPAPLSNPQALEKRRASRSPDSTQENPSKRPRTEEATHTGEEDRDDLDKDDETIDFDQVYQDGNAQRKYLICEHPRDSGKYYILRCLKHGLHFQKKPTVAAAKHLGSKLHPEASKGKDASFEALGVRVINCTREQLAQNNAVAHKAFNDDTDLPSATGNRGTRDEPSNDLDEPNLGKGASPKKATHGRALSKAKKSKQANKRNTRTSPGITNPVIGELYQAHWPNSGKFYGVLMLPLWDFDVIGLEGSLNKCALWKKKLLPPCYSYDATTQRIIGWEKGYECGGSKVANRKFPVLYFDAEEFRQSSVGWVVCRDLKEFTYPDTVPEFHDAIRNHLSTRKEPIGDIESLMEAAPIYRDPPGTSEPAATENSVTSLEELGDATDLSGTSATDNPSTYSHESVASTDSLETRLENNAVTEPIQSEDSAELLENNTVDTLAMPPIGNGNSMDILDVNEAESRTIEPTAREEHLSSDKHPAVNPSLDIPGNSEELPWSFEQFSSPTSLDSERHVEEPNNNENTRLGDLTPEEILDLETMSSHDQVSENTNQQDHHSTKSPLILVETSQVSQSHSDNAEFSRRGDDVSMPIVVPENEENPVEPLDKPQEPEVAVQAMPIVRTAYGSYLPPIPQPQSFQGRKLSHDEIIGTADHPAYTTEKDLSGTEPALDALTTRTPLPAPPLSNGFRKIQKRRVDKASTTVIFDSAREAAGQRQNDGPSNHRIEGSTSSYNAVETGIQPLSHGGPHSYNSGNASPDLQRVTPAAHLPPMDTNMAAETTYDRFHNLLFPRVINLVQGVTAMEQREGVSNYNYTNNPGFSNPQGGRNVDEPRLSPYTTEFSSRDTGAQRQAHWSGYAHNA